MSWKKAGSMPSRSGKFPEIFYGAAMLHDLDRMRKDVSPARDRIRLGIDREFNPVLQYYIRRLGLSWLSVESCPKASAMDFLYLKDYYMEDFVGD